MATACPCGRSEVVGADERVEVSGKAVENEACVPPSMVGRGARRALARARARVRGLRCGLGRFQQRQRGQRVKGERGGTVRRNIASPRHGHSADHGDVRAATLLPRVHGGNLGQIGPPPCSLGLRRVRAEWW